MAHLGEDDMDTDFETDYETDDDGAEFSDLDN